MKDLGAGLAGWEEPLYLSGPRLLLSAALPAPADLGFGPDTGPVWQVSPHPWAIGGCGWGRPGQRKQCCPALGTPPPPIPTSPLLPSPPGLGTSSAPSLWVHRFGGEFLHLSAFGFSDLVILLF